MLYRTKAAQIFGPCITRKGELEYLALNGRIPGKRARGAQHFTFNHNLKGLCKNPGNLWALHVVEHNEKHHSTPRSGSAMIPQERERLL